ncbi:hypothetical protein [Streptomyces griseosporeus]|uniref:hypothetical protein n=1 Tax=Streptomyces griseosporeus TaxID=1910 RepID=UPI00167E57A4|nr:hypothetical protein [Streptomyces griseosporeus]GHF92261.1 hypothetical protein GCM10018783_73910 [Streptomyces griseosporeus]
MSNGGIELEKLAAQIAALESDRDQLKELIRETMDMNNNQVSLVQLWEVVQVLAKWANGDD